MAFWVVEKRGFSIYHWYVFQTTDVGVAPTVDGGKTVAGPFTSERLADMDVDGRRAVQEVLEVFETSMEQGGLPPE